MASKHVVLDEFHIRWLVPVGLSKEQADAMTRLLLTSKFQRRLQKGIAAICRRDATLRQDVVRVTH